MQNVPDADMIDLMVAAHQGKQGETMTYLEFVEFDDYLAHLRKETGEEHPATRLEITSTIGPPDEHGIGSVTYYAVATQRLGDHIAIWSHALVGTSTFDLDFDKHRPEEERTHTKLHTNFAKVRERVESMGLRVERGKWTMEAPVSLREG